MQTERVIHVLKHGKNIPADYIDRATAHRSTLKDEGTAQRLQLAIDGAHRGKVAPAPSTAGTLSVPSQGDADAPTGDEGKTKRR